ncbi:hypothetical protein BGZ74_002392 [Mortierella antarctica]|nr:hypothetical protein BGZ74_002392 [Mortierella antarctica]
MLFKKYSLLALAKKTLRATTEAQFAPDTCDNCLIQNMRQVASCGCPTLRMAALVRNPATYTPEERECVCALASNKSWATKCYTCDGYVILMLTTQLAAVQSGACVTKLSTSTSTARTSIIASTIASAIASTITSTQSSGTTTAPAPPSNNGSGIASLKASASVDVAAITAWALL